jgi:hypothetical protein
VNEIKINENERIERNKFKFVFVADATSFMLMMVFRLMLERQGRKNFYVSKIKEIYQIFKQKIIFIFYRINLRSLKKF